MDGRVLSSQRGYAVDSLTSASRRQEGRRDRRYADGASRFRTSANRQEQTSPTRPKFPHACAMMQHYLKLELRCSCSTISVDQWDQT